MTTATVSEAAKVPFVISADRLEEHRLDMARRQAEREAKRPLLMKCIDPKFAAVCEADKPVYQWRVQAKFDLLVGHAMEPVEIDESVTAQNERDAWAATCDRLQINPSIREAKPTFKRGKQLSTKEIAAVAVDSAAADKPRRRLLPKEVKR